MFPISNAEDTAIEVRIMTQQELVVAAAVLVGEIIVMVERPGRHGDCINFCTHLGIAFDDDGHYSHGFVTSRGRFVDRQEAARIVVASKQGSPRLFEGYVPALFTEDMWNGKEGSHHPDDHRIKGE